jgi:molecular chaperone GrpE
MSKARKTKDEAAGEDEAPADGAVEVAVAADTCAAEPADVVTREEALAAEAADLKDQLLRALAETENVRRRLQREKEEGVKYAAAGFAKDMLSVADNLRRALDSAEPDALGESEPLKTLHNGVEMVERELVTVFERAGIKRIAPVGEKFDHDYHQAMFEVPGTDHPNGTVVELLQPGYVMHGRLLRPALVGVAKGGKDEADRDRPRVDTTV